MNSGPVAHEQPLQRLERNAGRRPGRGIAGRDLAGIGEAGLQRRPVLPVEDDDLVPGLGQVVGGLATPITPLPSTITRMT